MKRLINILAAGSAPVDVTPYLRRQLIRSAKEDRRTSANRRRVTSRRWTVNYVAK